MKICLVNFANGQERYIKGQARLKRTFLEHGYKGDFAFYTDESQLGCPMHKKMPYAFKAYALMEQFKKGYDILIWADSLITLERPFQSVLKRIKKNGYILPLNGWTTGQWCSDSALKTLDITREEAFNIPHLMACLMAWDCSVERNRIFLESYLARAKDGTFQGDWKNNNKQVSTDARVLGHRHDQTAASVIAFKLGMKFDEYVLRYPVPNDNDPAKWPSTVLFLNKGEI